MSQEDVLDIAEIPYDTGKLHYRYARCRSADGTTWVRHGPFQAFHPDGQLASEGYYDHGKESGHWRDFHANGQLAAEGHYRDGVECGTWRFWDSAGNLEDEESFDIGMA